jgi:hypothetical protein
MMVHFWIGVSFFESGCVMQVWADMGVKKLLVVGRFP